VQVGDIVRYREWIGVVLKIKPPTKHQRGAWWLECFWNDGDQEGVWSDCVEVICESR